VHWAPGIPHALFFQGEEFKQDSGAIRAAGFICMPGDRHCERSAPQLWLRQPSFARPACYASNTASAPLTASALSITVRSSEVACTETFSAKNRASVT